MGYTPTGFRGSMERDAAWFRYVKPVRESNGSTLYVLRRSPLKEQVKYESIEPAPIGALTNAFVAYRMGCGVLLDTAGRSLGLAPFERIHSDAREDGEPKGGTRVVVSNRDNSFFYAVFVKGRKTAESSNWYVGASTEGLGTGWPPGYRPVELDGKPEGAVGVLDMATLREILKPQWKKVGAIVDFDASMTKVRNAYFVAQRRDGWLQLHTLEGEPIAMPPFDKVNLVREWLPRGITWDRPVLEFIDSTAKTCRIYSPKLQPLIAEDLPLTVGGECQRMIGVDPSAPYLAFTSSTGKTQVYEVDGEARFTKIATDIDGVLKYQFRRTGLLILETASDEQRQYRIVDPKGNAVNEIVFSDFMYLGCGFVRVKLDGKWMTPRENGEVTTKLYYPFSC